MQSYLKAIVAGLIAAISYAIPVVDDGLKASEALAIILAALVGSGVVYAVPNKDPRGERQEESVQPPEYGEFGAADSTIVLLLAVVVLILVLIVFLPALHF
jgi:hypothetical protein